MYSQKYGLEQLSEKCVSEISTNITQFLEGGSFLLKQVDSVPLMENFMKFQEEQNKISKKFVDDKHSALSSGKPHW